MGFAEQNPAQVRQELRLEGETLHSLVNGASYRTGRLALPSLAELRAGAVQPSQFSGQIQLKELVANVQTLHRQPEYAGAMFQAASQFNLLEMARPSLTPEAGVGIYELDHTQGPACAIACGAGTIYRNYLVPLEGQIGQSRDKQIDCLADLGEVLGNEDGALWQMQNGYALASAQGLAQIEAYIQSLDEKAYEALLGHLRIGLQLDAEVTLPGCGHLVNQAYCSALPIGYSPHSVRAWETFARLVLRATYEATCYAALQNYAASGKPQLFLTLVGGGVFGNELSWILEAIERSARRFSTCPLEVYIVSYGQSNPAIRHWLENWQAH